MEIVRVPINEDVLDKYVKISELQHKELHQVLANQLWRFQDVDSTKPLVLSDDERRHLEQLLARNFTLPSELVSAIQRMLSLSIEGVEVTLTPQLLAKLHSRAIKVDFHLFLQGLIKRLLEEYAGLR